MAQYNVKPQIEKIAKLKNTTVKEVARELGINFKETTLAKVNGEWTDVEIADSDLDFIAWNRREESKVIGALEEAKSEARQAEIHEKRFSTYRWVRENNSWVVAGNFTDKQIGDKITVVRADGSESLEEIVDFTEAGNAEIA